MPLNFVFIFKVIVGEITIVLGPRLIVWPVCPCFRHQDEGVVRGAEVGVAPQPLRVTVHREQAAPGLVHLGDPFIKHKLR